MVPLVGMAEDLYKECKRCRREMLCIDNHEDCYRHRSCTKASPCRVCKSWPKDKCAAVTRMIEKHKQKSKKPATVSRAPEESKTATELDSAKGKKVALPVDGSQNLISRNQTSQSAEEIRNVLSSEQIPKTISEPVMSSHSNDMLDNCSAVPSSEHESLHVRPGHSYDQAGQNVATPVGIANFFPFNMDQTSQGQMPFMFPPWMMGNMQEIIDKRVSDLLSKQVPAEAPKE